MPSPGLALFRPTPPPAPAAALPGIGSLGQFNYAGSRSPLGLPDEAFGGGGPYGPMLFDASRFSRGPSSGTWRVLPDQFGEPWCVLMAGDDGAPLYDDAQLGRFTSWARQVVTGLDEVTVLAEGPRAIFLREAADLHRLVGSELETDSWLVPLAVRDSIAYEIGDAPASAAKGRALRWEGSDAACYVAHGSTAGGGFLDGSVSLIPADLVRSDTTLIDGITWEFSDENTGHLWRIYGFGDTVSRLAVMLYFEDVTDTLEQQEWNRLHRGEIVIDGKVIAGAILGFLQFAVGALSFNVALVLSGAATIATVWYGADKEKRDKLKAVIEERNRRNKLPSIGSQEAEAFRAGKVGREQIPDVRPVAVVPGGAFPIVGLVVVAALLALLLSAR